MEIHAWIYVEFLKWTSCKYNCKYSGGKRKMRKLVTIRIDPNVWQKARETGLNISKTCENSLKQEIQRLKNANPETNCISTCDSTSQQPRLVGPPGFEPGSREPKSQSLDHASRRPLLKANIDFLIFLSLCLN